MVLLDIDGFPVDFPYEPYPSQRQYMSTVIKSLQNGWHAALESPTGTGKTLCLLCAALAWAKWRTAPAAADEDASPLPGGSRVRIYYASRTHSQLAQVVREFNKTAYKDSVKLAVLGSREQFCLNPIVQNETNKSVLDVEYGSSGNETALACGTAGAGADIEDLMSVGRRDTVCPYFMSRALFDAADLVLLPYNYILEPQSRQANKIRLDGAVVIFDEAHNVPALCEQASSVSLSGRQIAGALREARTALQQLVDEEESARKAADDTTCAFGALDLPSSSESRKVNIDQDELANLILKLDQLEKGLDNLSSCLSAPPEPGANALLSRLPGRVLPADAVHKLLAAAEIEPRMADAIDAMAGEVAQFLTRKAEENGSGLLWSGRGESLAHVASVITVVLSQPQPTDGQLSSFAVYLSEEERSSEGPSHSSKLPAPTQGKSICVHYWCLHAGVCMRSVCAARFGSELPRAPVRSCLLTSGTLAPLKQFIYDVGIPIAGTLESAHVIEAHRVWLGVLPTGPDSSVLDSSYKFRKDESYVRSLGNTVLNLCRVVPQGMLVFFASYAQLEHCVKGWKESSVWSSLCARKSVFVEPRDKAAFAQTMLDFDRALGAEKGNALGALLLAVARGKVSEGIDFSDKQARCVLLAGIPYPPMYDARVCVKKHYLTRRYALAPAAERSKLVDAETWYVQEAARALNQALGRAIRHREDFGAVLLADRRFVRWDPSRLPAWLRPRLTVFDSFGAAQRSLVQFYRPFTTVRTVVPVEKGVAVFKPAFDSTVAAVVRPKPQCEPIKPQADPLTAARAALFRKLEGSNNGASECSVSACYSGGSTVCQPPSAKRCRTEGGSLPCKRPANASAVSALSALEMSENRSRSPPPSTSSAQVVAPAAASRSSFCSNLPSSSDAGTGAAACTGRRRIRLVPAATADANKPAPKATGGSSKGDVVAFAKLVG